MSESRLLHIVGLHGRVTKMLKLQAVSNAYIQVDRVTQWLLQAKHETRTSK